MHFRMLHGSLRTLTCVYRSVTGLSRRSCSDWTAKPLRVLYCGSDEFSCASLRAVYHEHQKSPWSIASIDVMCRPGKPTGRGLKTIREVPIKAVAQELGLRIHERDTFTGWTLPNPDGESINLIITVSFGLFVPPRILKSAEYGGINIHPSMLPDFRGPAPLHHVLLAKEKYAGVTLQTLDPENFDHGAVLAQTPPPGLPIPKTGRCTYQELLNFIAPAAAEILVQGICNRVFDSASSKGSQVVAQAAGAIPSSRPLRVAPKINSNDRFLNWSLIPAPEIAMRDRVLGRLWFYIMMSGDGLRRQIKRVVVHGVEEVHVSLRDLRERNVLFPAASDKGPLPEVAFWRSKEEPDAIVALADRGGMVLIREITVDGEKRMPAWKVLDPESGNGFGMAIRVQQ